MKLLTPQDNANLKQSELARDSARTEQVRTALLDAQQRLDEVEAKFDLALAKQQAYLADEEQKYLVRIDALKIEVKNLEEQKKIAHFPIAPAERKAYDNLEKSKQTLLEAQKQKLKNEEIEEKLADKLDLLSERDRSLDSREEQVKLKEISATHQQNHLKFLSEELSKKWDDFYVTSQIRDKSYQDRERLIHLHENDLSRREDNLLEKQEELNAQQMKIQSDRLTLTAAYEEINRIKNGN